MPNNFHDFELDVGNSPRLYCARMSNSRAWRITVVFCLNFAKLSLTNSAVIVSVFLEKLSRLQTLLYYFMKTPTEKIQNSQKVFKKLRNWMSYHKKILFLLHKKIFLCNLFVFWMNSFKKIPWKKYSQNSK